MKRRKGGVGGGVHSRRAFLGVAGEKGKGGRGDLLGGGSGI